MRVLLGRVSADGKFPVTLHLRTTEKSGTMPLEPAFDNVRRSRVARAESVVAALGTHCPDLVRSFVRAYRADSQLLLEIEDQRLYDVPWESALYRLLPEGTWWNCFRVVPEAAPRQPGLPPYNVLWADVADPDGDWNDRRPPRELKYYDSTVERKPTPLMLADRASRQHFDVVHLAGVRALATGARGRISLSGAPQHISTAQLDSLLKQPPNLLLLEAAQGNKSKLTDFGHRYAKLTGSVVLVTEPVDPQNSIDLANTLYLGIAHNQSLDTVVASMAYGMEPPVLIGPPGGAEALRLDRPEGIVLSRYRDIEARASRHLDLLEAVRKTARRSVAEIKVLDGLAVRLKSAHKNIRGLKRNFTYDQETSGMVPMGKALRAAKRAASVIDRVAGVTERVVNTSFLWRRRPVPTTRDLQCGRKYLLEVQIGALSPHSNNRSPRGVPEKDLEHYMSDSGVELRVLIQSRHFQILEFEKPLTLPPRPLNSEAQTFEVVAPAKAGPGEILLLIYFRKNLLQAIRVWAQVSPREHNVEPLGNYAETEFALEQLTESVEELPSRDAQLYVSVGKNPTHTLTVEGAGSGQPFELSDGKLSKALRQARARLLQLAEDNYIKRKGRRLSVDEFLDDLRILAQTGFGFFDTLLPAKEREALATKVAGHRSLQIAHSRSLEQIYPWALVYDHPLFAIKPQLCPDARQVLEASGATVSDLEGLRCMSHGCSYRNDPNTICPSGFWGFRHTIELPLSLATNNDDNGTDAVLPDNEAMKRSIKTGPEAHLCMGAWAFDSLKKHQRELGKISRLQIAGPVFQKATLVDALKLGNQHILYLYCHGDHHPAVAPPTVLRLGSKRNEDYIYGTDMQYLVHLLSPSPLVFINGCHTLETDPDELVSFNRKLSEGGAAAVIGTEIKVPEILAAGAGENLLASLIGGITLGLTMRRFRLSLLLERNVLGLAYTSFGFSDLIVDVG